MRTAISTKSRLCGAMLATALLAVPAWAQEPESVADAQEAAERWLAQVDAGNYAASWRDGAAPFRAAVPQQQWESAMRQSRAALGSVGDRALKSATFTRTLTGQPDGHYVVIQYTTQFANKQQAVETVTPMREADGSWRVSGYYIQ
ncbi:DUF4019 domain-containing protein [Pseudoduganella chitinolytica]|uniref:DUF4019 domain-containing protein n=1 Tax=Pseudoduganella chitinolytica TaxID=34070 RepID=A0ABY8BH44_9BURK|nr:DUF4019 domain-containing protein [Pseudoduganella chitinolytica]WEF35247.1 DUF4019 domain-containing protein [Pseudoduganella chitinolytica]